MIRSLTEEMWNDYDSLFEACGLQTGKQECISVVGGGGKTTILHHLREECRKRQIFHGLSTTTHMQYVKDNSFLEKPSLESFLSVFQSEKTVVFGEPVSDWKMRGFQHEFLKNLTLQGAWLLLEADGAKMLPVKAPAEQEPVIIPETTLVLNIYGLDALGHQIKDVCFRTEKIREVLGKCKDEILDEEDLIRLASSELAGRKSVTEKMRYQVVLNKADKPEQVVKAEKIAEALILRKKIERVHITSGLMLTGGII